jgi:hypothetical protein
MFTCSGAAAQGPSAVRPMRAKLAEALVDGARVSPTLRMLVDELMASDVIVHVLNNSVHESDRVAGTTRFVNSVGGRRYVRVTVDEQLPHHNRIAILAHELQHAVEVVRAPWVVDRRSFGRLYQSLGVDSCVCRSGTCYETVDAQRIEARVLREVRAAASGTEVRTAER